MIKKTDLMREASEECIQRADSMLKSNAPEAAVCAAISTLTGVVYQVGAAVLDALEEK